MSEFSKNAGDELGGVPGTPVSPPLETDHEPGVERTSAPPRRRAAGSALRGERPALTTQQRLFILDSWRRSGLPGVEFGPLVGLSSQTLYSWKQRFARLGPAGLSEQRPRRPQGSRLPEPTQRAILMLKELHPEWGVDPAGAEGEWLPGGECPLAGPG
jgi:hypothetical protein